MTVAGFNYGDFLRKDVKDPMSGYNLEVFVNRELPKQIKRFQVQIRELENKGIRTNTTLGSLDTAGMAGNVLVEAQNSMRIYNNFFWQITL